MRYLRQTGEFAIPVELPPSQADLAVLLELSTDLRCVLDLDGNFLYLSPSWQTAMGYSLLELRLQPLLYWVHAEDRDVTLRFLLQAASGAVQEPLEHRLVAMDGRARWLRWAVAPNATNSALLGVAVDITESKAEVDLHRKAVESAPTAVVMVSESGKIVLVNRQFEVLFGYDRHEILGQAIEILVPEPQRHRHAGLRAQFLAHQEERQMAPRRDLLGMRKDGTAVQIQVALNPVVTAAGAHVLCSIVDITDRKRHEAQLQEHLEELQRHREEMTLLSEMSSLLQHAFETEEAFAIVASVAARLFPEVPLRIFVLQASRTQLDEVASIGCERTDAPLDPNSCWALRRGQVHHSALGKPPACRHVALGPGQVQLCIPMAAHGNNLGMLALTAQGDATARGHLLALESLGKSVADQLALALSNLDLREKLRLLSLRDPLTDLYNRRFLQQAAERELSRARRHGQSMALLMVDVDHFKRFNDTHGHVAADTALRDLARRLEANSRKEDVVCRYGGEEFVLILVGVDRIRAVQQAERLRFASHTESDGQVTLSIGVAVYPDHGGDWQELLAKADAALYCAKAAGRNQVMVAVEQSE